MMHVVLISIKETCRINYSSKKPQPIYYARLLECIASIEKRLPQMMFLLSGVFSAEKHLEDS